MFYGGVSRMKTKVITKDAARLMHEGSLALADLEHNGVRVDMPYLNDQIDKVGRKIKDYEKELRNDKVYSEWRKAYGDKTKLGSKEQLAHVVFDRLGYSRSSGSRDKKHKDDAEHNKKESKYDEATFQDVDLPFVKTYFKCEKWKKLKGTYLEGILREAVDGFVHPSYNLHTVVTYRLSCNMPNFQNVIARNPALAEIIRRCYIPRKGWHLVEDDFSTIEVRGAAMYTKDKKLIRYMKDPSTDMHRDMAAKSFFISVELLAGEWKAWAKKTVRDGAKNRLVFPMFYGSVYFQCAPELWRGVIKDWIDKPMPNGKSLRQHLKEHGIKELGDCTPGAETRKGTFVHHIKTVEQYLWDETFTGYRDWKEQWYKQYLKDGGFSTYTGFWIEGLFNRNDVLNYPIQGTAAHMELKALILTLKEMRRRKMKSLLVGTIHDCGVGDVPPRELQDYLDLVYDIKTRQLPKLWKWINVPIEVEMEVCDIDQPWNLKRVWGNRGGVWTAPKAA
jgi:DNA polymerase I-like protein with 3'-5' exonuclease and polymerase domains